MKAEKKECKDNIKMANNCIYEKLGTAIGIVAEDELLPSCTLIEVPTYEERVVEVVKWEDAIKDTKITDNREELLNINAEIEHEEDNSILEVSNDIDLHVVVDVPVSEIADVVECVSIFKIVVESIVPYRQLKRQIFLSLG